LRAAASTTINDWSGRGGRSASGIGLGIEGLLEQIGDRWRQGLVGIRQQQADLPFLNRIEDLAKRGHAGEANAVVDLPEGFAGRVVADADDAVAMGVP